MNTRADLAEVTMIKMTERQSAAKQIPKSMAAHNSRQKNVDYEFALTDSDFSTAFQKCLTTN